jgi:pimeloyl-ACP methyl ester carboxylesterase
MKMSAIKYKRVDVDGFGVAYREAGPVSGPALLLLHGFPTSSHMFRDLIPKLADRYRVVAPDLPGFGQSDLPSREVQVHVLQFGESDGAFHRGAQALSLPLA